MSLAVRRSLSAALLALAPLVAPAPIPAQTPARGAVPTGAARPTIAVLEFRNATMVGAQDYAPLGKGMAEMMVAELVRNPRVRVVEREQLASALAEQDLAAAGRVEAATAAKVGRLLGARHLLMGSFIVDGRENVRLDVRAVNSETGEIEYVETVRGKADRVLALVEELATRTSAGLSLPPLPVAPSSRPSTPAAGSGARGAVAATTGAATTGAAGGTTPSPPPQASVPTTGRPDATAGTGRNQFRAMMLLSRALEAEDRKDLEGARALYRNALEANPSLDRARTRLAMLDRPSR
jgi:TolB-like protein